MTQLTADRRKPTTIIADLRRQLKRAVDVQAATAKLLRDAERRADGLSADARDLRLELREWKARFDALLQKIRVVELGVDSAEGEPPRPHGNYTETS